MKTCKLCSLELTNPKDFNLIAGSSEFQPIDPIAQLPFAIASASQYVCRRCRGNLKLYVQAKKKMQKLEEELRETYFKSGSSVSSSCTHKEQASTIMESISRLETVPVTQSPTYLCVGRPVIAVESFHQISHRWQFICFARKTKISQSWH